MPTKGTPVRTFRAPDDLWDRARAATQARGTTVGAVLLKALERYVRAYERSQSK